MALPNLKVGRACPSAFQVNDTIYIFGGSQEQFASMPNNKEEVIIGEKFAVRENKWRDVISRSSNSFAAKQAMKTLMKQTNVFGPISLLYE